MSYVYAPTCNQLDGVMQPMNPLDTGSEGYSPAMQSWYLGQSETGAEGFSPMAHAWNLGQSMDDTQVPMFSPMIRSDVATPTVDIMTTNQFAMPALNGGLGAVQDALQVLAVVDLLSR